ncbi:MAG: hypothetical protein JF567_09720 [Xanthomonadales bacterium]|nr:hypothetical protein [Xanthomonadales bacterium]
MRHFVSGVFALLCLCSISGLAHAAEPQFAYCSVNDAGGRNIWVSQIFPAPPNTDPLGNELATEFHSYVGTLGGSGDKSCVVAPRQALEDLRVKIAGIMGKRSFGIRVYKWHDVQWTPSASMYARTAPAPAVASDSYVYCRTTDADARKQVTSGIFVSKLPPMSDSEHYATLTRYAQAFARSAAASHRVAPDALCIASDTQAEADKSRNDYRHAFPFSGIKIIELPWTPDPALASPPATAVQRSTPVANVPASAASATGAGDDVEAEFWARIGKSRQIADYKDYLAAFPQGRHAPIARMEIRRLGGTVDASVAPPAAPVVQTPQAHAVNDALSRRVATEKFFQIPAGNGSPIERSGKRMVGTVPVTTTMRVQRMAGGNQCQIHSESTAGSGGTSATTTVEGAAWAGLLPLDSTVRSSNAYGTSQFAVRTISVEALQGQPFPLVEGGTFGYTFIQRTSPATGNPKDSTITMQCVVGATNSGTLQCTRTFSTPGMKPQQLRMHWDGAAGCFVQDLGNP